MKNFILILLVFFYYPFLSQNLTFSEINSKNILNLLNAESIKNYEQGSKTAVIQIGDNNKANVYDRSKKSDLMIRQTGDFNTTLMTNTNPEIENKQKVSVEGDNIDQFRTFYSCLYRMVFFPNKLYEVDAKGQIVHYSPYNGKVLPGYMFAGTGFWDTFRALYPFLNLVYPSINREMQDIPLGIVIPVL